MLNERFLQTKTRDSIQRCSSEKLQAETVGLKSQQMSVCCVCVCASAQNTGGHTPHSEKAIFATFLRAWGRIGRRGFPTRSEARLFIIVVIWRSVCPFRPFPLSPFHFWSSCAEREGERERERGRGEEIELEKIKREKRE